MLKKSLIFFGVFALMLLAGCNNGGGIAGAGLKDCGSDQKCFADAAKKCEPAKVSLTESVNQNSAQTYAESRGEKGGKCEYYMKIVKLDISNAPMAGVSESFKAKFIALIKSIEGKDLTCSIAKEQVQSTTFALQKVSSSENCSGSLKDSVAGLEAQTKALIESELQNQIPQ